MKMKLATYALTIFTLAGTTATDEALAKVSDYFASAVNSVPQRNSISVISNYINKGNGDCYVVNTIGNSSMSVSIPCNK